MELVTSVSLVKIVVFTAVTEIITKIISMTMTQFHISQRLKMIRHQYLKYNIRIFLNKLYEQETLRSGRMIQKCCQNHIIEPTRQLGDARLLAQT